MSRRSPSGPRQRRTRPEPKPQHPWVIRAIVVVAVAVVVAALVVSAASGLLFTAPGSR